MSQTTNGDSYITPKQTDIAKTNRKTGLLMMLVFLAPVVIAYILLKTGIYQNFGTSNKGLLIDPPLQISDYAPSWIDQDQSVIDKTALSESWWLAYEMPTQCESRCEQRLLQIRQSIQTLGPDQNRVKPLIITHADSDFKKLKVFTDQLDSNKSDYLVIHPAQTNEHKITTFDTFMQKHVEVTSLKDMIQAGGLYIVDPMGFSMLYYAPVIEPQEAISQAKSFVKDLKYLLKVSRIG
ncbi:MAG TPA: hypothetical protein DHW71_15345 [Gammaproteobacteria bacterium]|nr:hypothetical protein [Gammaproteobacteria bacterium]HCK94367.1 hypothetical protein [Gammaproteobacteria bacterium]|tara:strand:- start:269 stop:979 length:711 start_codon:yes stop_codon:yes gene_type:complete